MRLESKLRSDHEGPWVPNKVFSIYHEVSGVFTEDFLSRGRDLNRFIFEKLLL